MERKVTKHLFPMGYYNCIQMAQQKRWQAEKLHVGEFLQRNQATRSSNPTYSRGKGTACGVCIGNHLRESEYNRGTGCGKTARPGLCGGCPVTGIPTANSNEKRGTHWRLNQAIVDRLSDVAAPTRIHRILARLPISTAWTTNYDRLL